MYYIKSIIPFTEENRMLASSIVEGTKSLFSLNSSSSEHIEESRGNRQGAKRQCKSIFCECDCKRVRLESSARTAEKTEFVRVKSEGDAVLRSYNKHLKRRSSFLPSDRFNRSYDARERACSRTNDLRRRNSISSFSGRSSASIRSLASTENYSFAKTTKSAYAKLASSQGDLPSLKEEINSFPNTLRSYERLPNIRRQKTSVCSRNLSKNNEENEKAHSSDETELKNEVHSSDDMELKEEAHSSDEIELNEEPCLSDENSTSMVIPTQETSVDFGEITDNSTECENSKMDSSISPNISETSGTLRKKNETYKRIDWKTSNLQEIGTHIGGLSERINKMHIEIKEKIEESDRS